MARPPSIRLRVARVSNRSLQRIEKKMDADPAYVPTEAESRILLNLSKADALMRDRPTSKEEEQDQDETTEAQSAKAKELVAKLARAAAAGGPAFRSEDDEA